MDSGRWTVYSASTGEGGVAPPLAIVNIDAHLDVRPLMDDGRPTSGTPFRQLLESGQIGHGNFTEFAAQGSQCSADHAEYVRDRGGRIVWLSQLDGEITPKVFDQAVLGPAARKALFLSFDIDSIQSSDCPGVSCPATVGITAADAMAICRRCGAHDGLTVVDFSELNPAVEDYRHATARSEPRVQPLARLRPQAEGQTIVTTNTWTSKDADCVLRVERIRNP